MKGIALLDNLNFPFYESQNEMKLNPVVVVKFLVNFKTQNQSRLHGQRNNSIIY